MTQDFLDGQDPRPENNFFWRRIFSGAFTLLILVLVYLAIGTVGEVARNGSETAIEGLIGIVRLLLYLDGLIITYYLLAPSAEQIAVIIQSARSFRAVNAPGEPVKPVTTTAGDTAATTAEEPVVPTSPAEVSDGRPGWTR